MDPLSGPGRPRPPEMGSRDTSTATPSPQTSVRSGANPLNTAAFDSPVSDVEGSPVPPSEQAKTSSSQRIGSALTSPALLGGGGMSVVSIAQAPLTAIMYAVITGWSLVNEIRAKESKSASPVSSEDGGEVKTFPMNVIGRFLKSPSIVISVGAGISFATGLSLAIAGDPLIAAAFIAGGIGNSSLAALVNRQLGYEVMHGGEGEKRFSFARLWSFVPDKIGRLLANPVVSFATCNMLFSAASPGAFSNPSQITALVLGGALGVAGIVRGSRPDARALRSSLLYGAAANVAFGVNALLGGAFYSAAALGLWTLQNISAWNREASSVNR